MAIGTPALVATATSTANSATVTTAASGSAVAAGSLLILLAEARVASTITTTFSASGGGLSYTTCFDASSASASNGTAAIGFALNPSGLSSGLTWTATFSASATRKNLSVYSVSGLATASPEDTGLHTVTNNPKGSNSGNAAVTADAATVQNDEILFFCCKHSAATSGVTGTPSGGWTELEDLIVGASTFMQAYTAYRIISASETPSITATFTDTTTNWLGGIAGFKGAAAATRGPQRFNGPTRPRSYNRPTGPQIGWR